MMKRKALILVFAAVLALCAPAAADEDTAQSVTLCHAGEVTAVDLRYRVGDDAEEITVALAKGVHGDWNYVADEHMLYVSVASADAIDLAQPIAVIDAGGASLEPVLLLVNGRQVEEPAFAHTPQSVPGIPASCDKPGLSEGSVCAVCDAVLKAREEIPATGPVLSAELDAGGTLRVQGALSDAASAEGTLLAAVYASDGRMLTICDLSEQPPNAIDAEVSGCTGAAHVSIFRLNGGYVPLDVPVEIAVK